jgi:hypothetical protein
MQARMQNIFFLCLFPLGFFGRFNKMRRKQTRWLVLGCDFPTAVDCENDAINVSNGTPVKNTYARISESSYIS